jgi:hypothetical protein
LGLNTQEYEWYINNIIWYDWDNNPRWFVNISKFSPLGTKVGYVEIDMWPKIGMGEKTQWVLIK